jgi:hypothetical protein
MPSTLTCEPTTTELVTRSRYLGSLPVPADYRAHVSGLAADDRYIYATWHLSKVADGHDSPGPGELLVLDPELLADPTGTADPIVARITVGYQPRNIAVNRVTGRIYVVNYGQQGEHPYSVFAIAADSFEVIARIPIGQVPIDVAVNEATNRIYVGDPYGDGGRIHVIDGDTHTIVGGVAVPSPNALAFDASTSTLYAVLNKQFGEDKIDAVGVIACGADGTTHTVTKIVPTGPQRSVPWEVAVLTPPAGPGSGPHRLLVANMGAVDTVPPNVTAFDLHDGSMHAHPPVPTAFGGPVGLAVNAGAGQAYVATNAGFQVLDILRGTIESPVKFGPFAISAVVDAAGRVHVGDAVDGTLTTVLPVPAQGPIAEHVDSTPLGAALTGPLPVPGEDPRARYQVFESGVVVASTDYGAVTMSRDIADGWLPRALALGVPTEGGVALVGEYEIAPFQRGLLVYRAPSGGARPAAGTTIAVNGPQAVLYQRPEIFAALGLPVAEAELAPSGGGVRQRFDKGEIYWRADIGAHALWGPIWTRWLESGGTSGPQGYPLGDVALVGNTGWEIGEFEDGTMYNVPGSLHAHVVRGEIAKAYEATFGGPFGFLGFPAGNEKQTATGGWYQDFEHGVLVWFPAGHQYEGAHAYRGAELRLSYASIAGDQGPIEGDRDLYIRGVIERIDYPGAPAVSVMNRGFPYEGGDYDDPSHTFAPHVEQIAEVMRGSMEFQVMFASYDKDDGALGGSEQTGTVNHGLVHPPWNEAPYNWDPRPAYTVDNLWGFEDAAEQTQYKLLINYKIVQPALPYDESLAFRQQWWWKVNNFDTERISVSQYARAYADVDPTARWLTPDVFELASNTWEATFYHLFVKGIGQEGNCYGMSVEAIYAMKQLSIFTEPVYQYGTPNPDKSGDHYGEPTPGADDDLINEFNVRHASQLGAPVIDWFLRLFGQGLTHNPIAVFENSLAAYERGDWPVLNFSRFWGNRAHTVLPIAWNRGTEESPLPEGVYGEIYIADPFHEWDRDGKGDDWDGKYKVIVYNDNRFEYDGTWAGGDWIDSRMYWIPWSRLNGVPNTPGLGLLMEVAQSGLALFAGDANLLQVTDADGRRLFAAGLTGAPRSWNDLERDTALRIPGLVPVPLYGAAGEAPGPTLLHATGTGVSHTYHIAGTGGTYRWGVRTPAMSAVVMARSSAVADLITAEYLGTADRAVSFSVPAGGANKTVSFILNGLPRADRGKQFVADALSVVPTQKVSAQLRDGGRELLIVNSGQQTNVRIRVRPEPDAALTAPKQVPLAAGKVTRMRPADWQVPSSPLQVEVRDTVDGPPVECYEL